MPQSFLVLAFCDQNMGFYLKCTPIGQIVGSANVDGREMNNKVKAPSTRICRSFEVQSLNMNVWTKPSAFGQFIFAPFDRSLWTFNQRHFFISGVQFG